MVRNELYIYCLLLTFILFGMSGCINSKRHKALERADRVFERSTDSAEAILAEIEEPHKLNRKDFAHWCMLSCQITDKQKKELLLPTDLVEAQQWYSRHGSTEEQARISLFLAKSLVTSKDYERAMEEYLHALDIAEQHEHFNLAGYISSYLADLYMDNSEMEAAVVKYNEAAAHFKKGINLRSHAIAHRDMARAWAFLDSLEIALEYLALSDSLMTDVDDPEVKASILNHYGNVYGLLGDYSKAEEYYQASLACDTVNTLHNYEALIHLYVEHGEFGKARLLQDSILQLSLPNDYQSSIHYNNYQLYKQEGYPAEALANLEQFLEVSDLYQLEQKALNFVEMEKKYDQLKIVSENQQLKIHRQYYVIVLILICIVLLTAFVLFQKKQIRLKKEIIDQQKSLHEFNTRYNQLKRTKLLTSGIGKKLSKLSERNIPQNDQSLITPKIWKEIENEVKNIYPDFFEKIYTLCPDLNEAEWQYCCLILFDFTGNQEAVLLNINPDSARKRRLRIRQKLGITLNDTNLYNYFANTL